MAPIIRAVLSNLMSVEEAAEIDIIANDVRYTDEAQTGETWEIVYRHPERCVFLMTVGTISDDDLAASDMTRARRFCLTATSSPSLPCSSVVTVSLVGILTHNASSPCSRHRPFRCGPCRLAVLQANEERRFRPDDVLYPARYQARPIHRFVSLELSRSRMWRLTMVSSKVLEKVQEVVAGKEVAQVLAEAGQ